MGEKVMPTVPNIILGANIVMLLSTKYMAVERSVAVPGMVGVSWSQKTIE